MLEGSSRARMCDSVLTPQQVKLIETLDTKALEGTDVAGPYTGQDPPLLWTAEGIETFKAKTEVNSQVTADFLEKHPKIRQLGLSKRWFKEEKESPSFSSSSFSQVDPCNLQNMEQCNEDQQKQKINSCVRGSQWQYSDPPDEIETSCQMIGTKEAKEVATPEDCLQHTFENVGTIARRFFQYRNYATATCEEFEDCVPEKPILCHVESTSYPCEGTFDRSSFGTDVLREMELETKGFDEYIFWIDETVL